MLASPRRGGGRFPTGIEQTCALDLTAFATGSAVLTFEYAGQRNRDTLQGDPGVRVAEEMLDAMRKVEANEPGWETGLQSSVLDGWETLAKPLGEGVDSIAITLVDGKRKHTTRLTRAFRGNLRGTSTAGPQLAEGALEGVLWECDWKEHTGLLDEADGNRVTLSLPGGMDERITELRHQRVRVSGSIERHHGRAVRVVVISVAPTGNAVAEPDPRYGGFWENLDADELAKRQGVGPVQDLANLAGDWPPEDSIDEFLRFVREVRRG